MPSPLVTRPPYGQPIGESQLPGGGPSDRGLPLDPGIPGSKTFAKPPNEEPRTPGKDDESIHRVDDADDLTKDRDRVDVNEDNADKHDGIGYNGEGPYDGTGKTKYPYRDGRPNTKIAHALVERSVLLRQPRVAAQLADILRGLDKRIADRARGCRVSVKTRGANHWTFSVQGDNAARLVELRAEGEGMVRDLPLTLACSCPAWKWQGPEHHARVDGYLEGRAKGTATTPREKDPRGKHRVCKHVAAVLDLVKGWKAG